MYEAMWEELLAIVDKKGRKSFDIAYMQRDNNKHRSAELYYQRGAAIDDIKDAMFELQEKYFPIEPDRSYNEDVPKERDPDGCMKCRGGGCPRCNPFKYM